MVHLEKAEIDEKDGKIKQLETEKTQQQAHIDALDAHLKQETEKRKAYEEHIIGETRKQKQQSDHLKQAMLSKQKLQQAALQAHTRSTFGGGNYGGASTYGAPGVPAPQMHPTTSMQYGAGSTVAPPQSWAQGGGVSHTGGYLQEAPPPQHGTAGLYPVRSFPLPD
eukprot:COSAG06_NODE_27849_length_585_cov_1.047325_1_plen_166_part_00